MFHSELIKRDTHTPLTRKVTGLLLVLALAVGIVAGFLRPAGAALVTYTIQPSSQDSYIRQDAATTNYGAGTTMQIQSRSGSRNRRGIVQFDTSAIPAGATVESASLQLYMVTAPASSRTDNVHRVTNSWLQGAATGQVNSAARNGVTWRERQYGDNLWTGAGAWDWAAQGGDFNPVATASAVTGTAVGWKNFDVTADVQGYVSGVYANNGWIIKDSVEDAATAVLHSYRSRENTTLADRPVLAVTYVIGSTAVIPGSANANTAPPFTVTMSNTGGASGDEVQQATFTIPAGYTGIPTTAGGYTVTAPGGKTWTVTGLPAGSTGPQTVTLSAATAADDLTNAEDLQVGFTATAPASLGPTLWASSLTGRGGGIYTPADQTVNITDNIAPDTVITAPSGGTLTGSSALVSGTASDNVAVNTVEVAIQRQADSLYWNGGGWVAGPVWNSATITSGGGTPASSWQYSLSLPGDDGGSYDIQARASDGANTDATPAAVSVSVDNTAPTLSSFFANGGAGYTSTDSVNLQSSALGATEMRFAESAAALAGATYQSYAATTGYTLSSGDGLKTIYAQYRDAAGNATAPATAGSYVSITYDATEPVLNFTDPFSGQTEVTILPDILAHFLESSGIDPATINSSTFYVKDSADTTVTASVAFNAVSQLATLQPAEPLSRDTTYTAYLTDSIADLAGNSLAATYSWSFTTGAENHMTIQPGQFDTYLDESLPSGNYGTDTSLKVASATGANKRSLIKFDLSTLPGNISLLEEGKLKLFMNQAPSGSRDYQARRVTSSWTESGATWNTRDGSANWTSPGGDFAAATDTTATGTTDNRFITWDITQDVKDWYGGTATNYGTAIIDAAENDTGSALFYSRDYTGDTNLLPELEVGYLATTATVSPTSVYPGQNRQFTITVTNVGDANAAPIFLADVTIPAGFTDIPTVAGGYTVIASNGGTWEIEDVPTGSSGPQYVKARAVSQPLGAGDNVQIVFNAIAPITPGSTSWEIHAEDDDLDTAVHWATVDVQADVTPPTTSITDPIDGSVTTSTTNLAVTGTAADAESGVKQVDVRIYDPAAALYWNGFTWQASEVWNPAAGTNSWSYVWSLPTTDKHSYQIISRATDSAGNTESPLLSQATVYVDNVGPNSPSVQIENGAGYATTSTVTLAPISAADSSTVSNMRFSNNGTLWSSWEAHAASRLNWNLSDPAYGGAPGGGVKTVYAQFQDAPGNVSSVTTDTVNIDDVPPTVLSVDPPNASTTATLDTTVTVVFSELNGMDASTINGSSFYLKDASNNTVASTVSFNPATNTAYLKPASPLGHDANYTAYLADTIKDAAGNNLASIYSWSFRANDVIPPDTSIISPLDGSVATGSDLLITGTATDNDDVTTVTVSMARDSDGYWWNGTTASWQEASFDNQATITSGYLTPSATWQYSWELPSDNGLGSYVVLATAWDDSNNSDLTPAATNVFIDNVAPQVTSFTVNNDSAYTVSDAVTLSSDTSEAVDMRFAESTAALSGATWEAYSPSRAFTLSAGDGAKSVYAQYRDVNGNVTAPGLAAATDFIVLDTAAPVQNGVFPASGSTSASRDTAVTIDFLEDNEMNAATISGATFFLKDAGDTTVTTSVTYNPATKRATLTPPMLLTEGATYTAYVTSAIEDAAGNSLAPYSWNFTIADSTPPDTVITDPAGGTLTGVSKLITGAASDNMAVDSVQAAIIRDADGRYFRVSDSTWVLAPTWNAASMTSGSGTPSANWQLNWFLPASDNGSFTLQARAVDSAANPDLTPSTVVVNVDNAEPDVISFAVNAGAAYATTSTVDLESSVSGASEMRFAGSVAALSGEPWQAYAASAPFTLSAGEGQRTVYAQYRDAAGNVTPSGAHDDSITVDTIKPVVDSTYPANNATDVSLSVMVTATFNEASGIDASTINSTNFYMTDPGGTPVPADVNYESTATMATLVPQVSLSYDTTYTAHVTTDVKDAAGNALALEKVWAFKTVLPTNHPPAAPGGLSVVADDMKNVLAWTAPSPASDPAGDFDPPAQGGYNIYRATSAEGPWSQVNGALVKDTTYQDTVVATGRFYYKVVAVDGASSESAATLVRINTRTDMKKSTSTSAGVVMAAANAKLTLAIPPQNTETEISAVTVVSPPTGVTPVTDVFEMKPDGATFSDPLTMTFETPGDPTGARVRYYDGSSWKEVSGGDYAYDVDNKTVSYNNITHFSYYTVTNGSDATPPSAPASLALSTPADGEIKLDWTAATDLESGINGYVIYRSLSTFDDGSKASLAQVIATPGSVLTYTDGSVIRGETYYYAVSAENGAGLEGPIGSTETTTATGKENAHTGYSSNSNLCRDCHAVHDAPANVKKLARKAPEIENCYVCHDGTGSDFNIKATFAGLASHDTSMTAQTGGVTTKCTECHNPHGVGDAYYVRASEENLCYKCHNSTASSVNGWNVQEEFGLASRHAVTGTTGDGLTGAKVECTNCHGPHGSKAGTGISDIAARLSDPFNTYSLWTGNYSDFCISCHRASGFPAATATSSIFVPYSIQFPSVAVYPFFPGWDKAAYASGPAGHSASYTCQTCHAPHSSPNARLLAYFDGSGYETTSSVAKEENLCYQCHKPGGPDGAKDLLTQFSKDSTHPVDRSDLHSDTDTTETLSGVSRHAECFDCHDVHQAKAGTHNEGSNAASNVLAGVKGVAVSNGAAGSTPSYSTTVVSYEYQVCFKCHSSYVPQPGGAKDMGVEFNTNNPSYHPVEGAGANSGVSSSAFVGAWSTTSTMYCSDCHTTNDTVSTTTPSGPHGSDYGPILGNTFDKIDGDNGGNSLCYNCHAYGAYYSGDAGSRFYNDTTTTSEHQTHVGSRKAPCYACHDTHGRTDNAHLVRIKESGETTGTTAYSHDSGGGSCQATCHNSPTTDYTYKHKY